MKSVPAKNLRTQHKSLLGDLKKEKATLLTDAEGHPAAYLIESAAFEGLQTRLRLLEGIARGEKAYQEGRTLTQTQARKKMARWLRKK